jgi:hypothetical protein
MFMVARPVSLALARGRTTAAPHHGSDTRCSYSFQ